MISIIYRLTKYFFLLVLGYTISFFFVQSYIESNFVDGSYGPLLPIYGISEVLLIQYRGSERVVTPFIGVFERYSDDKNNMYYENIIQGRGDTYQALIYDNVQKSGIVDICDQESGELLYCGCVSESSRWCMVHIQF